MTNRHVLVQFVLVTMLFSIVACQEHDESIVSGDGVNDADCQVIVHQMNDISLSKSKHRYKRKRGVVYLYNFHTDSFDVYQTMKISDMNDKVMQEWLLSDLNEDYFDGQFVDASTDDFFYKWKGEICNMSQGTWEEYIADENENPEKGFHVLNVVDLQKLVEITGDFSDACDTLRIKPYGYYTQPGSKHWNSNLACLWLFPVSATTKYYGMAANSNSGCGVFARITPGADSFAEVYTNIKELYARVRLVRNISKEQW